MKWEKGQKLEITKLVPNCRFYHLYNTELIFVDRGVKVNRDVLLSQQMLPAIKRANKTALRHIAPATPSSCSSRRRWTSSVLTSLAAKQPRSEPCRLQDLGSRAAACTQMSCK